MTYLYNRRQILKLLETEAHRADRYKTPLSISMIDIDHFKKINDTLGHTKGDKVLVQAYARDLVAAFSGAAGTPAGRGLSASQDRSAAPARLPEPLSERELEVLRLVAGGYTNREIADELVVAVSTVKSHTNSIYGKLGVKNRTQAVALARSLGIV